MKSNKMYKFVFTRDEGLGKSTYECTLPSMGRTKFEMFEHAVAVLDLGIYTSVQMFDPYGICTSFSVNDEIDADTRLLMEIEDRVQNEEEI